MTLEQRIEACRKKHQLDTRKPWQEFIEIYGYDKFVSTMSRYARLYNE